MKSETVSKSFSRIETWLLFLVLALFIQSPGRCLAGSISPAQRDVDISEPLDSDPQIQEVSVLRFENNEGKKNTIIRIRVYGIGSRFGIPIERVELVDVNGKRYALTEAALERDADNSFYFLDLPFWLPDGEITLIILDAEGGEYRFPDLDGDIEASSTGRTKPSVPENFIERPGGEELPARLEGVAEFEVGNMTPKEGTIGTVVTITGSGFGNIPGKVLVGGIKAQITSWSSTSIGFLIKKIFPAGTYDVSIVLKEPKGAAPIQLNENFTIKMPEIVSLSKEVGSSGEQVSIAGSFFGIKNGKVSLVDSNGKSYKCKVVNWTMNSLTNESTINFIVPPKALGACDVTVINKIGTNTKSGVLLVPRTPTGPNYGTAPLIKNVVFFRPEAPAEPIYIRDGQITIYLGERLITKIYYEDPDVNVDAIYRSSYYPSTSETPVIGPILLDASQATAEDTYTTEPGFAGLDIFGLGPGQWKLNFVLEDSYKYLSEVFTVYVNVTKGTAPVINEIEFFRQGPPEEFIGSSNGSITVRLGETIFSKVYYEDPDLDADRISRWNYYPSTAEEPIYGPFMSYVNQSAAEDFLIGESGSFPHGEGVWRLDYQMVDAFENQSQIFPVYVNVTAP